MSLDKEGQRAVQAVREKIKGKFFTEKTQISMSTTDKDKDIRAKENLKEGETYKDRNGQEWTRENGTLSQVGESRLNLVNPLFCPKCKGLMGGPESKFHSACYMKYSHCFNCQLKFEKKLKLSGKFDDWVTERRLANQKAYLRDVEEAYEAWLLEDKEIEQFVMNSSGELETWFKDKNYTKEQQKEVKQFIEDMRKKVNKQK